jgi:hypothetical protein
VNGKNAEEAGIRPREEPCSWPRDRSQAFLPATTSTRRIFIVDQRHHTFANGMASASDAPSDAISAGGHNSCEAARQLRERQNSLAPLCRLPVEILAGLFYLIKDHRNMFTVSALRHTCRALNNVSLATPRLWSDVDLQQHPEWCLLCNQRAGPVPLSLTAFKTNALLTGDDLSTLFQRSSRIYWHCHAHPDIVTVVANLLNSSAPLMRSVSFVGPWRMLDPCAFSLTPKLLGGDCSNLVHLVIDQVALEDAPPLPNVETLSISICSTTFSTYRRIIQRAPNVKDITLDSNTLEDDPEASDEITPIDLPHLVTLSINQARNETLPFLYLLPNPSQRFTIQDGLGEKAIWTGAADGEDEVIPTRLRRFWQTATGEKQLPYMRLAIQNDYSALNAMDNDDWMSGVTYILSAGTNCVRESEVEPSLWWMTQCEVTETHPLLDLVIELKFYPLGGRIYLGDPESLDIDLFENIEYVIIQDAYSSDELWERYGIQDFVELAKWLARRAEAGKRMKILEIGTRCHREVKNAASSLAHLGLVEGIVYAEREPSRHGF